MNSPVDEIKRRIGIEEVVGSYIELKQAGKTLKALCPFHSEKTPSFSVSTERQSFYCFGCNRGGDIFTFVEEFEGVDFRGALKILAERAGVDLRQYGNISVERGEKEKQDRLYSLLNTTKNLYRKTFLTCDEAQKYMQKRGISEEISKQFEIGLAPNSWSYIFDELINQKFTKEEIMQAGLIIEKEEGGYYDRFRNRIMFPIADSTGRIIAFSGRTLDDNKKIAKYINSPETKLFKKRDILYGIDKAKRYIRKLGFSVLVEGQMDLVLSHQAGFRNTVATSGTALRGREDEGYGGVSNLELIKRISKNIVIAFDSDNAGNLATIKNAQLALSLGMDVKVAVLPPGDDPADVILRSVGEWKKLIKESMDAIEFHLAVIQKKAKDKKAVLKAIQQELFQTINSIPSKIDQEHYLTIVSEMIGISTETLSEEFYMFRSKQQKQNTKLKKEKVFTKTQKATLASNEQLMLAFLINAFATDPNSDKETLINFEADFSEIFGETAKEIRKRTAIREKEKYIFEIEKENRTLLKNKNLIEYLLKHARIKELEKKARNLLSKLRTAEHEAERETAAVLFQKYSAVLKDIEKLKQNHES